MSPFLDTLLFLAVFSGLSLPFARLLPRAGAPERLCVGAAGALLACALAGLAGYLCLPEAASGALPAGPRSAGLLLPAASLACLWLFRREARELLADAGLRQLLLGFLLVCAGSLACQALVVSYSGGAWAGDWLEHYGRALFFREHQDAATRFTGIYTLTARPPLINLACAALMQPTGAAFLHYQVFSCLFACLAFLPMGALVLRHSGEPAARAIGLLALLCLLNPLWVQNTGFPWTKLPTAFLVLSAVLLLEPAAPRPVSAIARLLPWLLLSLAMLAHYSAAPWVLTLASIHVLQRWREWRQPSFWREALLAFAAASLLFSPWLLAALHQYGVAGTFGANTTVGSAAPSLAAQLRILLLNLRDTLVPHILRSPDTALIAQTSLAGSLRDNGFNLYQLCLPLLCGFSGLLVLLPVPFTCGKEGPACPRFWLGLLALGTLLGIAVHTPRDEWGLAHICLQPLGLLGLVLLCIRLPRIGGVTARLYWLLATADWLLGVVLGLFIQSLAQPWLLGASGGDGAYMRTLSEMAQGNLLAKLQNGLGFLGDLARPWQAWLVAAVLTLLLTLLSRAMGGERLGRVARRALPPATAAAALVLLAGAAWLLRGTFMVYDDEGYVLLAARNFSLHGGLYDRVYSQYGPFFHLLLDGLGRLGWTADNLGARSFALAAWGGAAAGCLALAWRLTRNLAAAALAMAAAFIHLWQMANEPSHPGGLVVVLLVLGALAGFHACTSPRGFAFATGVVAAALVLTKINVGLFFIAGAGLWLLLHAELPLPSAARRALAVLLAGLMPWALMHGLLAEPWVRNFALVSSLSFAAALLALRPSRVRLAPGRLLPAAAAGFLLLSGMTVVLALARGSSLRGLLDGVLLSPLRMPTVFSSPIQWRPGVVACAAVSPLAVLLLERLGARLRSGLLLGGRLLVLAGLAASLGGLIPMSSVAFAVNVALPALWLFVAPLDREGESGPPFVWLLLIGMTQVLHAYPVAGSQLGWGSLLLLPLLAASGHETWTWLTTRTGPLGDQLARLHARLVTVLILLGVVYFALIGWNRQDKGEALMLPGAESIVVPQSFASTARVLQNNLVLHCDSAFSMPGMFSFNLWSGLPAPTLANATHWFTLLSPRQKQELLEALQADPHPGLIVQRGLMKYLEERGIPLDDVVSRYLRSEFQPFFQVNDYEFWLRKSSRAAIVGIARVHPEPETQTVAISLNLASEEASEIASIELHEFDSVENSLMARWAGGNFLAKVTPLLRDGTPRGPTQLCRPPFRFAGLNHLEVLVRNCPFDGSRGNRLFLFRNSAGARVGEAFFLRE